MATVFEEHVTLKNADMACIKVYVGHILDTGDPKVIAVCLVKAAKAAERLAEASGSHYPTAYQLPMLRKCESVEAITSYVVATLEADYPLDYKRELLTVAAEQIRKLTPVE